MRRVLFLAAALSSAVYGVAVIPWSSTAGLLRSGAAMMGMAPPGGVGHNPLAHYFEGGAESGEAAGPADSLRVLRRMSRVYEYQARIMQAQAEGDRARMERYLEEAVAELSRLAEEPGMTENPLFRERYESIVEEYERHFGAPAGTLALPRGEIYEFRDSLFATLNDLEAPLLEDVVLPEVEHAGTTIPMTTNRLVESSIGFLRKGSGRQVAVWLSRAATYFPMIEHVLWEEQAPDELKYLALIESGLNPRARSWAGAAGMWQFMPATGRQYGLTADTYVDERLDPEKATRAAARYLKDLHEELGDWHLALAAYNCGPGNVGKAIRRLRQRSPGTVPTFWTIYPYLPAETRNYVPMYIAAALVASDPVAFGVQEVDPGPAYEYDLVELPGRTALASVAGWAGTSEGVLKALNPELRREHLPPGAAAYPLRIPSGSYEQLAAGVAREGTPGFTLAGTKPARVRYGNRHYQALEPANPGVVLAEAKPPAPAPAAEVKTVSTSEPKRAGTARTASRKPATVERRPARTTPRPQAEPTVEPRPERIPPPSRRAERVRRTRDVVIAIGRETGIGRRIEGRLKDFGVKRLGRYE